MHQGLCHVAKKDGKPVEGNAKCETHTRMYLSDRKLIFTSKQALLKKLSRVIIMCGTLGLVMETLGWTKCHLLKALMKLN